MDPPTEILEGASPMDGKAAEDAVSVVLDNGDLLLDLLLRLGLHSSLVRAILVNKRWFSVASDPFLLRWFRRLHPPRLLGFYVATRSTTSHVLFRPRFVPMPPPESDPELAAAVRMAETYSGLDAYDEDFACICDLQNDTLLVSGFDGKRCQGTHVHWPLSPHRGVVAVPVIPYELLDGPTCTIAQFLLKLDQGGRDSLVYVMLAMGFVVKGIGEYSVKYKAHVYVLQEDGQWRFRASPAAVLPSPKSDSNPLLVGTKIYLEHSTSIAVLDLKTSTFSSIPLPEGMEKYDYKEMMLAPADDSGIFLLHLDENLQLCIWLRIGGGTPKWVLFDVVDLSQMFETLGMTGWTDDDEPATLFQTTQMGDFLEFVFLKLGQCAFCFDTRRRVLLKLYEETQEDQTLERFHPLMMTWPPKFPALKGDHVARNVC
ncbi:unnamed protein product [Alopecurus aequalis]